MKWLNKILKPGFAHVRVVIHKPHGQVLIDPRISYTYTECYPSECLLTPNDGETHVRYEGLIDIYKMRRFFGPLNCVEVVKGFLGIRKPFILTPYQLYKEVTKNGINIRR